MPPCCPGPWLGAGPEVWDGLRRHTRRHNQLAGRVAPASCRTSAVVGSAGLAGCHQLRSMLADRNDDGPLLGADRTSAARTRLSCPADRTCDQRTGAEPDAGRRPPGIPRSSTRNHVMDRSWDRLDPQRRSVGRFTSEPQPFAPATASSEANSPPVSMLGSPRTSRICAECVQPSRSVRVPKRRSLAVPSCSQFGIGPEADDLQLT